jgi:hypothetical protein
MGKTTKALVLLALIASMFTATGANAASEVVTVTNPNARASYVVPTNLKWSKRALTAATSAQKIVYEDLKAGIELLADNGATRLVKVKNKWQTQEFPDWKRYVPDILSYELKGYQGNTLVMTHSDPHAGPELASRLIYLKQSSCSLTKFKSMPFQTWSAKYCPIVIGSKENYLRASIRVFMSMGESYFSSATYAKGVLTQCLAKKFEFTIKNNVFSCPKANTYPGHETFPLTKHPYDGGYLIKIDAKTKTAKFTYLEPKWQEWANLARYQESAVINFW